MKGGLWCGSRNGRWEIGKGERKKYGKLRKEDERVPQGSRREEKWEDEELGEELLVRGSRRKE